MLYDYISYTYINLIKSIYFIIEIRYSFIQQRNPIQAVKDNTQSLYKVTILVACT